jgi:Ser/Thr protein kinase RdoA (MazF antagonist)
VSPEAYLTLVNVSENSTYRVHDPRSGLTAAMRVHRPGYHSEAAILSELAWMEALRQSRVVEPPRPIAAKDGSLIITARHSGDGPERHVVLFEWLPGEAPIAGDELADGFRVLGALAAKMHAHGRTWNRPTGFCRYTCDYDAALGVSAKWGRWQEGLGIGLEEKKLLQQTDDIIKARLEAYGKAPSRFGLTHNDLRLANLLIDDGHVHVIDFDDCGFSWYMYDFATAVSFMEDDPRVPELMEAWVEGYERTVKLSRADREILPTLVMLRRLLLVGWVGSHHTYAVEAAELGAGYTTGTCAIGEGYLSGTFLA